MDIKFLGILSATFYASGLVLAVLALWRARTPQGATAWVVALIGFPFLAVPAFLVFGRNKFYGYSKERKQLDRNVSKEMAEAKTVFEAESVLSGLQQELSLLASTAKQPGFTEGNNIQLLVDGEAAYASMLAEIQKAKDYIIVQFYIFRDDTTGEKFKNALIQKAKEGLKIYFLCDRIGTTLRPKFLRELLEGGIEVQVFKGTKRLFRSPFQINFRNHRKILIVDGHSVHIGGLNIGDDYLGKRKSVGPWRDTHVKIEGPAALAAQISFQKDWYWVKEKVADLKWLLKKSEGGHPALVMHTGPADETELCLLSHMSMILSAKKRLWIANPYFVPPEGIVNVLALAAQRGVDVRILVPSYSDNSLVMFASHSYIEKLLRSGVTFFKYMPGFLHQKVMLIDNTLGMVGSVNMDSRSFFINFEILAASSDPAFVLSLENMFKDDFEKSESLTIEAFVRLPLWRQIAGRAAGLLAPII